MIVYETLGSRPSLTISTHVKWPELSDYFLGSFDWFVGGKIGEIAKLE